MFISFRHFYQAIGFFLFFCLTNNIFAKNFPLPANEQALLGNIEYTTTAYGDTTATLAERYNIGLNSIVAANPGVKEQFVFPRGVSLKIVTQFILPPVPRRGIVINLPEMRLYYYPEGTNEVMTFPIGIGRIGKVIPIINTAIKNKKVNPNWIPTQNIRKFNEEQGIELPPVMPAGPDNPLGPYAIYLKIPAYLIHSTIFPESIGRRASFGCIRMNESDIKEFFPLVKSGTPVEIIDMPYKIAWHQDDLYLEAHLPLEERANEESATLAGIIKSIQQQLPRDEVALVNWQLIAYLAEQADGIPHEVGFKIN